MVRRRGRQGLLWTAAALLVVLAVLDLMRGPDSYVRGWWSGMNPSRGESTRSVIEQARERRRP